MNDDKNTLARVLGYGGLLPFMVLALATILDSGRLADFANDALLIYGAVILSFLGGVVWGRLLAPGNETLPGRPRHFCYSVLPALLGWAAALIQARTGLLLLAAGFAAAWMYDKTLERTGLLPPWYLAMRVHLTIVVVLALLLAAIFF